MVPTVFFTILKGNSLHFFNFLKKLHIDSNIFFKDFFEKIYNMILLLTEMKKNVAMAGGRRYLWFLNSIPF